MFVCFRKVEVESKNQHQSNLMITLPGVQKLFFFLGRADARWVATIVIKGRIQNQTKEINKKKIQLFKTVF